jgi:hypothetical protein
MKRAWPKSIEFASGKASEYLALMIIELDEEFEQALEFILPLLIPHTDHSYLFHHLEEKSIVENKPHEVLRLLSKIFTTEYEWPPDELRGIMNKLAQSDQAISDTPDYTTINNYLIQHSL